MCSETIQDGYTHWLKDTVFSLYLHKIKSVSTGSYQELSMTLDITGAVRARSSPSPLHWLGQTYGPHITVCEVTFICCSDMQLPTEVPGSPEAKPLARDSAGSNGF